MQHSEEDGPEIVAPVDPRARAILEGFRMCVCRTLPRVSLARACRRNAFSVPVLRSDWMNMSDASTGKVLWEDNEWGDLLTERDIHIPARILSCRAVSREFQFSSVEMLQGLRLEQRIFLRGNLMEGARTPHPHSTCCRPAASVCRGVWAHANGGPAPLICDVWLLVQNGTSSLGLSSQTRPTLGNRPSRQQKRARCCPQQVLRPIHPLFRNAFVGSGEYCMCSTPHSTCIRHAELNPSVFSCAALNGNVLIETAFYDDELLVCKTVLRVFYDA